MQLNHSQLLFNRHENSSKDGNNARLKYSVLNQSPAAKLNCRELLKKTFTG